MRTHLEETNLDYWQHLRYGMMHARESCYVVWTSFWHALVPSWYPYVAEGILAGQYKSLKFRRKSRLEYWTKMKSSGAWEDIINDEGIVEGKVKRENRKSG